MASAVQGDSVLGMISGPTSSLFASLLVLTQLLVSPFAYASPAVDVACGPTGQSAHATTSGMTDCRDPKGEPFGLERIKEVFAASSKFGAQQSCNVLLDTLLAFQDGAKQDDDVTLVVVKAK